MPLLILEVLCKKLGQEQDGREDGLLFDIVAGTSIGAMNAAIFVSEFLETQNWNKGSRKAAKILDLNAFSIICLHCHFQGYGIPEDFKKQGG